MYKKQLSQGHHLSAGRGWRLEKGHRGNKERKDRADQKGQEKREEDIDSGTP
jgi:hypothetical protein